MNVENIILHFFLTLPGATNVTLTVFMGLNSVQGSAKFKSVLLNKGLSGQSFARTQGHCIYLRVLIRIALNKNERRKKKWKKKFRNKIGPFFFILYLSIHGIRLYIRLLFRYSIITQSTERYLQITFIRLMNLRWNTLIYL